MARHDRLVHLLAALAKRSCDPRPKLEQVAKERTSRVGGQVGQARLDVIFHIGARRILVDVTIVSPHAGSSEFTAACARRDGHAARRAAIGKRAKYDCPDLVPFAVETGGRLGNEARALLHMMAKEADDPQEELAYLYRAISSVLQDGVAKHIIGE